MGSWGVFQDCQPERHRVVQSKSPRWLPGSIGPKTTKNIITGRDEKKPLPTMEGKGDPFARGSKGPRRGKKNIFPNCPFAL